MNFNRNRSQLFCERISECLSLEDWTNKEFKEKFKNLVLNKIQAKTLSNELLLDSKDLYFKGLVSFFEALNSVNLNLFSWATIKLYYSTYYFLRCAMALSGIAIIRQDSLFYLKALNGESPVKKNNKKYNSDHSGTINHFIDLFSSDILLSQQIEMLNAYEWLMKKREQINYRERVFNEPHCSEFWSVISRKLKNSGLEITLKTYIQDEYILCFQEEHAILAIPIKRAFLTKEMFSKVGVKIDLSTEKKKLLVNLIPVKMPELNSLLELK